MSIAQIYCQRQKAGKYALKIDENAQPVAHPPRPIPAALGDATKKIGISHRKYPSDPQPHGVARYMWLTRKRRHPMLTFELR